MCLQGRDPEPPQELPALLRHQVSHLRARKATSGRGRGPTDCVQLRAQLGPSGHQSQLLTMQCHPPLGGSSTRFWLSIKDFHFLVDTHSLANSFFFFF